MNILPSPLNIVAASGIKQIRKGLRGVYLLIQGNEVVYVGQSESCIFGRVNEGTRRRPAVTYVAWHASDGSISLDHLELRLIENWYPIHNKQGKPVLAPWESSKYPDITKRPDFWEEYARITNKQLADTNIALARALDEIDYYNRCSQELITENRRLKSLARRRAFQNTKLSKKFQLALNQKPSIVSTQQEYPYIGGVLLSRETPIILQSSKHHREQPASSYASKPSLPVWVPGHGKIKHPKKNRISWLCRKIGRVLFGII